MSKFKRGARPTSPNRIAVAPRHAAVGATEQVLWLPKQLDMWANDVFGDCVTAEEAFAKGCGGVFVTRRKVVTWARKNWVLNGAGLWEVLSLMQTDGFDQAGVTYNDGPFAYVDYTDAATLQSAVAKGPVKLGVCGDPLENVPNCGVVSGWVATGLVGGQQDHCVSLCGYGPSSWLATQLKTTLPSGFDATAYALFTWSTVGIIDAASLAAITGEAWLRTPTTVEVKDA